MQILNDEETCMLLLTYRLIAVAHPHVRKTRAIKTRVTWNSSIDTIYSPNVKFDFIIGGH